MSMSQEIEQEKESTRILYNGIYIRANSLVQEHIQCLVQLHFQHDTKETETGVRRKPSHNN